MEPPNTERIVRDLERYLKKSLEAGFGVPVRDEWVRELAERSWEVVQARL